MKCSVMYLNIWDCSCKPGAHELGEESSLEFITGGKKNKETKKTPRTIKKKSHKDKKNPKSDIRVYQGSFPEIPNLFSVLLRLKN